MDWDREELPQQVKLFLLELQNLAGCARRKLERTIYARNARKGRAK